LYREHAVNVALSWAVHADEMSGSGVYEQATHNTGCSCSPDVENSTDSKQRTKKPYTDRLAQSKRYVLTVRP